VRLHPTLHLGLLFRNRHNVTKPVDQLLDFRGCTVVVTGASGCIGTGIACRFAEAGARLAVHYHRDRTGAEKLCDDLRARGTECLMLQAALDMETEVERLMRTLEASMSPIEVWINNAAVYPNAGLLDMSATDWRQVIDTTLTSVQLCTQVAGRHMCDQGSGSIVNVASIEGLQPGELHAHYAAAKAGVLMHTRAAAQALGALGVRVNAVSPGLIERPGLAEAWPEGVERYLARAPLPTLGTPVDVADACLFLASPASRWVTGANLLVDGGLLSAPPF